MDSCASGRGPDPGPTNSPVFATTHWSVVVAAGQDSLPEAEEALSRLCQTYWYPLYAFVRRQGYEIQDAQDMTQGFFARFLAKHYLREVDRKKGRFRSFLLTSIKHFLANEWDRSSTMKRGGEYAFISWDDAEVQKQCQAESVPELPAERVYERQWALTMIEKVFARLREECAAAGKASLFQTLQVYLSGEKAAVSYGDVAVQLNMAPGAVQVAVHRMRRRYGELLRAEIAQTVSRPEEIDEEIRHLFGALRG